MLFFEKGGGKLFVIKLQQLLWLATINFSGHAWSSCSLPDVAGEVKTEDRERVKEVDIIDERNQDTVSNRYK